jgi:hypothetical protein
MRAGRLPTIVDVDIERRLPATAVAIPADS